MPRSGLVVCGAVCLLAGSTALGRPNYGRNCRDCHGGGPPPVAGALEVLNFNGLVDPDESGTGATDRGLLKFFEVAPGGNVDLSVRIDLQNLENFKYAVELKRMETTGVENGGTLTYSPDPAWFLQTGDLIPDPDRPYFTTPQDSGILFTGPQLFTFTMFVDPSTDPDFYDLEFAMGLRHELDFDRFYEDEHFYLHVTPEPATLTLMVLALGVSLRRRRLTIDD
ncbi:MAG: PEP-CTERM sorting domain-containing protein [Phycisphaerae bacterium]